MAAVQAALSARVRGFVSRWRLPTPKSRPNIRSMSDQPKQNKIQFDLGGKRKVIAIDEQAEANKFYNWFRTARGARAVGGVWVTMAATGALYHVAPHWFMLKYVKDIYQNYTKGFKTKVRENMLTLINEVTVDMEMSEKEVRSVDVFVSMVTEPWAWGELGQDVLLGFPEYFYYDSTEEVPVDRMRIGVVHDSGTGGHLLKRSQAESEACSEFAASMILSNDAKMFSIAREFWRAKYTPFYLHSAITAFFIFFNYRVARLMNRKLDLFKRPPLVRGLGYLAILPWVFLTFLLVKDAVTRMVERDLDRAAAGLGPRYAAGGEEFYSKQLQRNRALRALEGEAGADRYTGRGELAPGWVRTKHTRLQDRIDICRSQIKEN